MHQLPPDFVTNENGQVSAYYATVTKKFIASDSPIIQNTDDEERK